MEKVMPLVSIIVPNYNHEKYLKQRLESVFNQTYTNFEVVLLDDCSNDKSRAILSEYAQNSKVSYCVFNEGNSGSPFRQWQKGINLAKGDYIWIAESDDFCELNFVSIIMESLVEDSSIGLGYCQTLDVDEKGLPLFQRIEYTQRFQPNIWENDFVMPGQQFVESHLSIFNVIPNASAVIFKKNTIDNSFFLESLLKMKMCGDWYFWIKVALKSNIHFKAETLNYFRDHHTVSRIHNDVVKKKKRLLEEKEIRSFMQSVNINNRKTEQQLYQKWFELLSYKTVSSKYFFEIKLTKSSVYWFLWFFIKYMFKRIKFLKLVR
jgi:glycosyltransferase involved in cell wall biosynthesis